MALNRISTEIIGIKLEGAQEAERQLDELQDGLEQVEGSTRNVDRATRNAGGGFSSFQASLTTAGAAMAGFQAAASLAASALSAIKAPINLASDFESQFAQVRTLNNAIGDDLKNQLLQLAAEVPQTAGDLTSATYQAISAGVAPTDVIDFMRAASQTAIAAGGSLTEAVEILTAGVNAFGNQGETAGSISNKLFATVKRGVTTIPELNAVFGRAAAAASSYGVSVDEVLGAIAQLTLQGLPTTEAVTRVNAVLKELSSESSTAGKKLKAMGVEVGVTALQQKGLLGVLEEVNKATDGSADAISRLSNRQEAVQGLLKLTGQNMSAFSGIVQGITTDTTAAAEATQIMADTTAGSNALFEAAAEGALRELGNELLPAFTDLLKSITKQLGSQGASGGIQVFGKALSGIIKLVDLFVQNVGKIAIALTAAFGARYSTAFIAGLAKMRAATIAFHSNFTTMAAAAGTNAGRAYAGLFLAGAKSILLGPVGIGLGVLFGGMLLDSFNEANEEAEKRSRERAESKASEDLAVFVESNEINMKAIEERLKTGQRERLLNQVLLLQREAITENDRMRIESLGRIATFLNLTSGQQINFNKLFFENAGFAKDLLVVMNDLPPAAENVGDSFENAVASAGSIEEKIARVQAEIERLTNAQDADAQATANRIGLSADLEAAVDKEMRKFEEMTTKRERAIAATEQAAQGYGSSTQAAVVATLDFFGAFDTNADVLDEQVAKIENARLSQHQHTLATAEARAEEEARGATIQTLQTRVGNLQGAQALAAKIEADYKQAVDNSTTALEKRLAELKKNTDEQINFFAAIGATDVIEKLKAVFKFRVEQAKKQDKEEKRAFRAGVSRANALASRNESALKRLGKMRDRLAVDQQKNDNKQMDRLNKFAETEINHEKELTLARQRAAAESLDLNPLQVVEMRIAAEKKFYDRQKQFQLGAIEEELQGREKLERLRLEQEEKKIRAMKIDKKNQDLLIGQAQIAHKEKLKQLKEEANEKRVLLETDARRAEESRLLSDSEDRKAAQEELNKLAAERTAFINEMLATDEMDRLARFDAETARLRQEYEQEVFFTTATQEEKANIEAVFLQARRKLREKEAKEVKRIEQKQLMSAITASEQAIGTIASIADNLGRSDSFVGKIEAAQIIAKGVYHGFQGASDQADALSHFQKGNIAGGVAAQAAAIAHFAQAAAAPVFARRAATRQNAGGGAAYGGGGVSSPSRGPRSTAFDRQVEERTQQQGITFGDIVLADIPALLSRQGAQALGRQVAGSVARELSRQRALPNGARI